MSKISKILAVIAIGIPLAVAVIQADQASKLQTENKRLQQAASRQSQRKTTSRGEIPARTSDSERGSTEESEGQRLARLEAAADESIRQQKEAARLDGSNQVVSYSLIEAGGIGLSAGAAKAAGLSKAQQEAVAGILRKTWTDVSDDFARRATLVDEESDESVGHLVYQIPARRDRGKEFKDRLQVELDGEVGEAKRKILMKGVQSDDFMGGFGRLDVRLEFLVGEELFKFAYLNPLNGEPSCFGGGVFNEFKEKFGQSFELPPSSKEDPKRRW